jgi:hypothetical protein
MIRRRGEPRRYNAQSALLSSSLFSSSLSSSSLSSSSLSSSSLSSSSLSSSSLSSHHTTLPYLQAGEDWSINQVNRRLGKMHPRSWQSLILAKQLLSILTLCSYCYPSKITSLCSTASHTSVASFFIEASRFSNPSPRSPDLVSSCRCRRFVLNLTLDHAPAATLFHGLQHSSRLICLSIV